MVTVTSGACYDPPPVGCPWQVQVRYGNWPPPGENCHTTLAYVALHVVRKFDPQGAGLPETKATMTGDFKQQNVETRG